VVVLASCVLFYLLSFAQALLPISAEAKSVLFIVFFGLAKTAQYSGLAIVGVKGWQRIKSWFKRKKELSEE
jgi:phosphoglycolate phosphatase